MTILELQSRVRGICEAQSVKRLDLFGSRARSLGAEGRDYDLVVELGDLPPAEYSKRFFGLLHHLEDTLDAPVDLTTYGAIKKQSLRQQINAEHVKLYER